MKSEITELEQNILKTAAQLEGKRFTIEEIADKVGCSPLTIHKRLQDEEFRELFLDTLKNSLSAEVPEVLNSFVERAKGGSFKHGKLVLEIAGVYKEKKEIKGDFGLHSGESPFENDEERRHFLKDTLSRALEEEK